MIEPLVKKKKGKWGEETDWFLGLMMLNEKKTSIKMMKN